MDVQRGGAADEGSRQVHVRFVTKLPPSLRVPKSTIAVPSNLTRMGLSEIVNRLILSADPEFERIPFDFLVNGELIRLPLEEFLLAKGISAERVLEVEYIKAVVPKQQEDPLPHDDWVSSVDGSNPGFVLTGCYDNNARIWRDGAVCTHVLNHDDIITSVHVINKGNKNCNSLCLATASKDRSLRLWKLDAAETLGHPVKLRPFKILRGHMNSVQSVTSDPSGDMVCSGSWDCSIKLWKVEESEPEADLVSTKKRKVKGNDLEILQESQLEASAASTFAGHTQSVSAVVWPESNNIYSASWDHSIRIWDVQTGKDSWNMVTEKAFNCLDVGGEASSLIVAGASDPILRVWDPRKPGLFSSIIWNAYLVNACLVAGASDPILRVWDPRKPGTLAPIFQFSFHKSWISACKWHRSSWFHLLSSSYDGKVMLWDLRTVLPLAVIDSHADKVLSVDWWKHNCIVSGGADSKLCISSGISVG